MQAVWDTETPVPTQQSPQLALIMVPRQETDFTGSGGGGGGVGVSTASATGTDKGWVFPVNKPHAPDPRDNQALAVNTTDGTTVYEAAFAMVWVTDNSDAMNVNGAQAYASCNSCSAVAVAYQVVFVIDSDDSDDNVVAPQNLAGALNYECANCLTYGLARQVFITLDEPLSPAAMVKLGIVWARSRRTATPSKPVWCQSRTSNRSSTIHPRDHGDRRGRPAGNDPDDLRHVHATEHECRDVDHRRAVDDRAVDDRRTFRQRHDSGADHCGGDGRGDRARHRTVYGGYVCAGDRGEFGDQRTDRIQRPRH